MDDQILIIAAFRRLIETELQEFLNASQQLGEPIFGLGNMVRRAFRFQLSFIIEGVYMERPDDATFRGMIDLMSREINDINQFREQNRNIGEVYNHISTISESIMALSWISVDNTPVQFIREMRDAGQYYGNRVLSQHRGNQPQQNWINRWNQVISALEAYVREYHRTGFAWNLGTRVREYGRPRGSGDADVALSQARGPPPPPPPPRAMDLIPEGGDNRQNLLRDLNQGVDIVRSLSPPPAPAPALVFLSPPIPGVIPSLSSPMSSSAEDASSGFSPSSYSSISSGRSVPNFPPRLSPSNFSSSSSSESLLAIPARHAPISPEITSPDISESGSSSESRISTPLKQAPLSPDTGMLSEGASPSGDSLSLKSSTLENVNTSPSGDATLPPDILLPIVVDCPTTNTENPMLKPVSKDQPSQSQQSLPSTSGENITGKPVAERTYPAKFLLDGRKWRVEHQKDRYDLVIDSAEMSQSLAIFKCHNSGLEVRNKLNGVTIDNCNRSTVVLRDIISSVELIRCQHVKLQCMGHVPLISIDNCDSIEIYLTKESLDVEIISSKSSSLNVSVMKPDGDYVEMAVPEQIKTVVVGGRLVSTVVEKI